MLYGKALNKRAARILAFWMALMMVFTVCGAGVSAETEGSAESQTTVADATIPSPTESFYIYDDANVLTEATENEIITRNTDLNTKYGMQVVVMTMEKMPGEDFASRASYANQVIAKWEIGGEKGYGLLLVLSVSDQDYVAVAADGFKTEFTSEVMKTLLDEKLEPSFKVEAYDVGVQTFVTAVFDQAEPYMEKAAAAAAAEESANEAAEAEKKGNVFLGILKGIGIFLLIVVILLVVLLVVVNVHGQMVRKKRREARRRRAAASGQRPAERAGRAENNNDQYSDFMNRYK